MDDTAPHQEQRKFLTIIAADMAEYTPAVQLDDSQALVGLKNFRTSFSSAVKTHRGLSFGMTGDSLMAYFPSPVQAIRACLSFRERLLSKDPDLTAMPFRMGVHIGDAIIDTSGDVFGHSVNVAARLEQIAPVGAINVSEEVKHELPLEMQKMFCHIGEKMLKNVSGPIDVFQIMATSSHYSVYDKLWAVLSSSLKLRPKYIYWLSIALIFFLILAFNIGQLVPDEKPDQGNVFSPSGNSIAVMPVIFKDGSQDKKYIAESLTKDLIQKLSLAPNLQITAHASVRIVTQKKMNNQEIGEALNVAYLLEVMLEEQGDIISISVQIVDAMKSEAIWSDNFSRFESELPTLTYSIAHKVLSELPLHQYTVDQVDEWMVPEGLDAQAYKKYLLANAYREKRFWDTSEALAKARALYEEVINISPEYADARAALGLTLAEMSIIAFGNLSHEEAYQLGQEQVDLALQLDPNSVVALYAQGYIYWGSNNELAIKFIKKALSIDPHYSDALIVLFRLYVLEGRLDDARQQLENMMKIDPLNASVLGCRGDMAAWSGHAELALEFYVQSYQTGSPPMLWDRPGYVNYHYGHYRQAFNNIGRMIIKAVAEENVNILVLSDGQIHLLPSYHERLVNMALTIDHIDVASDWSMGKFDDFIALYNGDPSKAKKIVSTVKYKQKDKGVSQFKRGKGEMFRKTIFYDVLLGNHASVIEALKGDGVQLVKVYLPRALGNHRHDLSSLLALSLLESGQEEKAHALLKRRINALMRALNSGIEIPFLYYDLACAYSVLGETDEAFHYLERAVKGGFLPWYMKHDPRLKKLLALSEMQKINVLVSVRLSEELLLGDDYAFTSSQIQEQAQLLIEH